MWAVPNGECQGRASLRQRLLGLIAWVIWPAAAVFAGMSRWPASGLQFLLFWTGTLLPSVVFTVYQAGSEGRFSGAARVLSIFAFAGVIAYTGIVFLDRYWNFFNLDTPLSGLGLIVVFYPVLFLAGAGAGVLVLQAVSRRTGHTGIGTASGLAAVALCAGLVLAYEVWDTTAARSREGDGDLSPFFAALLR